jgi:hypothetical protein
MVTYDILIILMVLALIVGFWSGILFAIWVLQEVIEKNKAKKPTNLIYESLYDCPNCKGFLSQKYKYCHKCGQLLDWSDSE